ncbi:hypothetical protein ACFYT4_01990 [Streptomyces sp. NPDC004609]|uniref:hypothetical protein n=1 Tax=Streptomyces sp. NPDC004609 TaxID=3364704 RepID=UPI0036AF2B93
MNAKWAAALSVLLSVAVGVVTNLLTNAWSWTLGAGFAVLVCALVAVAVLGTSSAEDDGPVTMEATSGGRVTGNTSTVGLSGRLRLRASRRGVVRDNTTQTGDGTAELRARNGEISGNETTIQ